MLNIKLNNNTTMNCNNTNSILGFISLDFTDKTIEELKTTFTSVTSVELYEEGGTTPFGIYRHLKYDSITENTDGMITVTMKILSDADILYESLLTRVETLEDSQQDQDNAILDIADVVFTE